MKKRLQTVFALAAITAVLSCLNLALAHQRVGGYREISSEDAAVVAAANFAVSAQGRAQQASFTLVSIERAEVQVVQGMNYRLCLKVAADADAEPVDVKIVVYRNLRGAYSLSSWVEDHCSEAAGE